MVTLPGILIEVSPLQPEKALSPILVTLFGMLIEASPLQRLKASFPILVTLFGILIEVSPLQRVKASFPILATLFGIEIYFIFEQLRNDELQIESDPSEITTVSILKASKLS